MPDKTPLQLLWEWVDSTYPNFNKADIEEKIKELRPVERGAIVDAHRVGDPYDNIYYAKQYYRTKYGETYH